ncbi:Uma2 family endonuclease [Marinoscillum sp.]|uniref:Uma2 family endonuclease n=1 Tax=Marinoscillum sp. TaxID=2024838 RepID=UPI003BABFA20
MILKNGYSLSFPKNLQFTDDELFDFCQRNPDLNIERDHNNNILIMSPTGSLSGKFSSTLIIELGIWNKENHLGHVFDSSTGFSLPDGSMRSPDVSWVSNEKWDQLSLAEKKKFAPVCPEFVVEVMSPSDDLSELKDKMLMYLTNGAQLGWLFDIENEAVFVYTPNNQSSTVGYDHLLKADQTLPGFEFDLSLLKSE